MDPDLSFVMGIIVGVFCIPAIVSSLIDGRAPRAPAFLVIIGGLLIGYAVLERPGSYSFQEIPEVFSRVIGEFS